MDETIQPIEPPKPPVSLDDLKRMFKASKDALQDADKLAILDRDNFDGDQIPANVRHEQMKRGQPIYYSNKIAPAVNGILGIIDAGESDPQAFPRNSNARQSADVATKLLRYVADDSKFKKVRKELSTNFIIQGVCAAIVTCGHDARNTPKVKIEHIHWEDFFYDHMSRESDFADARYLGIAKWMDADVVERDFPEAYAQMGDPFDNQGGTFFDAKADLEQRLWWVDSKRRRLRVVDMYHLDPDGNWSRSIFCERGFLWFGPSEYVDELGAPVCPIVASSFEIKQDRTRYGLVRNMITLQAEINSLRGLLLHLTRTKQVRQTDLAAPSASKTVAKEQAQKPDGVIPFGWEVLSNSLDAQGILMILQRAEDDLNRLAPTPAVLGRITSASESGRARQMLQQAGYTELARSLGRFEDMQHRIHEQVWLRCRQFFDQPMEIRITGNGRAPEFLMINEPVIGPVQQQTADPMTGQTVITVGQGVIGMKQRPADIDVDIILSTVPDSVNLEQEVWEKTLELVGTLQISPLNPSFDMILQLAPIPNKDELIERIQAMREDAQKANAQQMQMQQAFAQAQAKSEFELKQAKAAKDNATAQKTALETQLLAQQPQSFGPPN